MFLYIVEVSATGREYAVYASTIKRAVVKLNQENSENPLGVLVIRSAFEL